MRFVDGLSLERALGVSDSNLRLSFLVFSLSVCFFGKRFVNLELFCVILCLSLLIWSLFDVCFFCTLDVFFLARNVMYSLVLYRK